MVSHEYFAWLGVGLGLGLGLGSISFGPKHKIFIIDNSTTIFIALYREALAKAL